MHATATIALSPVHSGRSEGERGAFSDAAPVAAVSGRAETLLKIVRAGAGATRGELGLAFR